MHTTKRQLVRVAVYLILLKKSKLFMLRRANTTWANGYYTLPAGHVDENETIIQAMIREAKEEIGLSINPEDIRIVHAMHRRSDVMYIDYFLRAREWKNEPYNAEPEKCDDTGWFPLDNLPEKTLPHVKRAFEFYQKGLHFSEDSGNESLYK